MARGRGTLSEMVRAESKEEDDRDRHADQPQQYGTHGNLRRSSFAKN
jgi:hypothetical protein